MGGLGNQLFQVHAAASISDEIEIVLDEKLFNKRSQSGVYSHQEIFRIDNEILSGSFFSFRWITRRILGLILRTNPYLKHRGITKLLGKFLKTLGEIFFGLRYGERIEILAPATLGFEPLIPKSSKPVVLIGYFQSDRYVSDKKIVRNLATSRIGKGKFPFVPEIISTTKERPLIVHIRLGDYSTNPQIGMLDGLYYLRNLEKVYEQTKCTTVWLFSNEVEKALNFVPLELRSNTLIMESEVLSDSNILDLMSRGHAYFIANSTFSWWAARLSTAEASNIFAPEPWFANMPEPLDLIPKGWNRVESIFEKVV